MLCWMKYHIGLTKKHLNIENTLLKAANMETYEEITVDESLLQFYNKDIDGQILLRQLNLFPDCIKELTKKKDNQKY